MRSALDQAGKLLAESIARHLRAHGLSGDVHTVFDGDRIVVGSQHKSVCDAESGSVERQPLGLMEHASREAIPAVMATLAVALQESDFDRSI